MIDDRKMEVFHVRSKVISAFKMHGLSLRSDASRHLIEVLSQLRKSELQTWIDRIIEGVQKQPLTSSAIDKECVETTLQELSQDSEEENDKVFNLIDAFSIPRFTYQPDRKKFLPSVEKKPVINGDANDKADMFRDRYMILKQRTLRHELFVPAAVASANQKASKFELKSVEHLLGSAGCLENVIVLGMLTQMKEGKYSLEDPTGVIELDMEKALFHTGLYTENCFVLAEGDYDDGIFKVTALGFPPPETASLTRSHFGNINFFGGPSNTCVAMSEKLKRIENQNQDAMFVFLSDVWLDQPKVLEKLRILFGGYSEMPPALFVLCGNFCSKPYGSNYLELMKDLFIQLGNLISEFPPLLENSRFLFVPGPQDPGLGNIIPRPPILKSVTEELQEKVPFAMFTTNPCRIQYCTQEIIIMREDIINKMSRNCIHLPSDGESVPTHFVKTIFTQAHLCPLPLHVRPVYWAFDNALRVYPLPDVIICADKYDPYKVEESNCIVLNPGSFPRGEFSFKVYWPSSREVEDCKIAE